MTADSKRLLLDMIRIRVFEERCAELYGQSKIRGFLHLYIGEEAIAAGAIPELSEGDAILGTYREHAHALIRGVPANSIMAEMFGKASGCSGGRGGSMHLFDASRRFYGGNAIVGGHLPLAVGLALADKMQNRHNVTVCFFGEGAMAEGEFHEAMNLAALWELPVLFCCENNLYAMGTSLESSESQTDLALKASGYNMPAWPVDGMDVEATQTAMRNAITMVRESASPAFLEFKTYRFRAHSMFDPDLYRDPAEVERWKQRDPIATFSSALIERGLMGPGDIEELWEEARRETEASVTFAEESEWELVETLTDHVYASATTQPEPPEVGGVAASTNQDDWAGDALANLTDSEVST